MLMTIKATPRICFKIWSSIRVKAKMAIVDTTMNVNSIGHSRFQVTLLFNFHTMTAEVVIARSPDSVVASPYVGMKNGSIVIMKMPKPKPVVRCTKLAPMLNRNMAITRLLIVIQSKEKVFLCHCLQLFNSKVGNTCLLNQCKLILVLTDDKLTFLAINLSKQMIVTLVCLFHADV